ARLPLTLGLSTGTVVAGITLLGLVTIALAGRMERGAVSRRAALVPIAVAAIALGGLAALGGDRYAWEPLSRIATEIAREEDHVDVLDLAEWIRDHRPGLRVIDVREGLEPEAYRIPSAEVVPLAEIVNLPVRAGQTVVLYSDGGTHAAQAWVLLRARGLDHVYVVRDGLAAWEDDVLSPRPPAAGDSVGLARFRRARALSDYYGGLPSLDDHPDASTGHERAAPRHRRRNTC
ncbi:MAG TPA: rhodanese-like domain-containing protein, partial [Gemmatimonadales bacterium]|nr:rhodanese-like domain-containing protein [Gemmatimonadales bacterium]